MSALTNRLSASAGYGWSKTSLERNRKSQQVARRGEGHVFPPTLGSKAIASRVSGVASGIGTAVYHGAGRSSTRTISVVRKTVITTGHGMCCVFTMGQANRCGKDFAINFCGWGSSCIQLIAVPFEVAVDVAAIPVAIVSPKAARALRRSNFIFDTKMDGFDLYLAVKRAKPKLKNIKEFEAETDREWEELMSSIRAGVAAKRPPPPPTPHED